MIKKEIATFVNIFSKPEASLALTLEFFKTISDIIGNKKSLTESMTAFVLGDARNDMA